MSEPDKDKKKSHRTRDIVILGLVGVTAIGGIGGLGYASSREDVWFVNGLDVPVDVEIDGSRLAVGSQGRETKNLAVGMHTIRVFAGDRVIEESHIDVPRFTDAVVYNVLGASPIYTQSVVYSRSPGIGSGDGGGQFLGGVRFVSRDRVQYVFKEPPREIKVKGGGSITHQALDIVPGGWQATVEILRREGKISQAARLARTVARAEPRHPAVKGADVLVMIGEGAEATARMCRELRDATPEDLEIHIDYQFAMQRAGLGNEVLAEYRERQQKNPSSSLEAVMRARLELPAAANAIFDELVLRFPKDPLVVNTAARIAMMTGDPKRAVELFATVASDPGHGRWAEDHVRALVMVGRVEDAAKLVQSVNTTPNEELRVLLARAQLAGLPDQRSTYLRRDPSDEGAKAWMKTLLGENATAPAEAKDLATTLQIHYAALHDPKDVKSTIGSAPPYAIMQVHPVVAMLLFAELERLGEPDAARRLYQLALRTAIPRDVLVAWILEGKDHPELGRLDLESRAAIDFVRARVLMEGGKKADAALDAVKKLDVLRGPVSRALESWPAPSLGAESQTAIFVRAAAP